MHATSKLIRSTIRSRLSLPFATRALLWTFQGLSKYIPNWIRTLLVFTEVLPTLIGARRRMCDIPFSSTRAKRHDTARSLCSPFVAESGVYRKCTIGIAGCGTTVNLINLTSDRTLKNSNEDARAAVAASGSLRVWAAGSRVLAWST